MSTQHNQKTYYIPQMCDHAEGLAAALRATGQPAEVLAASDDQTFALGLRMCRGRECSPCLMVCGDVVRLARQPGFDPARAVIFLPTTTGSCRFGQYTTLLRQILDQVGLHELPIAGPTTDNAYRGQGNEPDRLWRLIWEGAVAIDLLQKLVHHRRPYELQPGATDAVYQASLAEIVTAIEAGAGQALLRAMERAAAAFAGVTLNATIRRPRIGIVGEIYVRHNRFANLEIIRRIEALGGEVELTTMIEWFYYINWSHLDACRVQRQPFEWLKTWMAEQYMRRAEHYLAQPVAHLLDHPYEAPVRQLMEAIRPYFSPDLANECLLSMGKTMSLAQEGICGMINVMPFGCMPGTITATMAPRIRADLGHVPWLDIAFDAQGGTNITTRLEAFMYQAAEFQRHTRGHCAVSVTRKAEPCQADPQLRPAS